MHLRNQYYESAFSFKPIFKAGIHYGELMIAEVGTVKKEIAFHGDVINTASRIQSLCNNYNAQLLVSETVLNNIILEKMYKIHSKGDIKLIGRESTVKVFEITEDT